MQTPEAAALLQQLATQLAINGFADPDRDRYLIALDSARQELLAASRHRGRLEAALPTTPVTPQIKAAWNRLIDQHPDLATSLVFHVPPVTVTWLFAMALEANQRRSA